MTKHLNFTTPDDAGLSETFAAHYAKTFDEHGATSRGADWNRPEDLDLRYAKMLEVITPNDQAAGKPIELLDVGCGYGGLYEYAQSHGVELDYTGIDIAENVLAHAREKLPQCCFEKHDILSWQTDRQWDYVVCNGALTQKLDASILAMERYTNRLIAAMFARCRRGLAFNMMTNRVNFMVPNLYYRSPMELLGFCMANLTNHIRLDHAYRLFDFTVYLYREAANGPES